ncbi:MAG: PaREP1 family protein [Dehalococcoidia bacterium]|nr:hypothetical protein [Chloroflexota bacterium]
MTIREFLDEGKRYIEQDNPVQASEKLYKAAEEAVKALALTYANGVWKEVPEKERWTSLLLFKAATAVARSLKNEEIRRYWDTAWFLHVEGFHEGKLDIDLVRERTRDIEELVSLAEADRSGDRRNRDE